MIYIIVPAYNEAKNIGRVVRGLFEQGFNNVVVVDDCSSDNTVQEATQAGAVVLRHSINRGQGAALQTGNEHALAGGAQVVVHFDGDRQFAPEDIGPAINFLRQNNLGAVLGSRFLRPDNELPFLKKYLYFPVSRAVHNLMVGRQLTDIHNGFRVFSAPALRAINITQDRMAHATEIIRLLIKNKVDFKEFPIRVYYHEFGQGIGGGAKIVRDLVVGWFVR